MKEIQDLSAKFGHGKKNIWPHPPLPLPTDIPLAPSPPHTSPLDNPPPPLGGQTRVDLATLAFFPCFVGVFGLVNDVNLIKTL